MIPGTAVSYAPYGDSVFVIEKKKDPKTGKESQTIRQQFVRVGEARGDFVSGDARIESGRQTSCGHGRFQIAQRHGRDDQQRSRAETAAESDTGRYMNEESMMKSHSEFRGAHAPRVLAMATSPSRTCSSEHFACEGAESAREARALPRKNHEIVYRSFHQAPGAGDRGQLRDSHCRLAGDEDDQRAAISAQRHRRDHGHDGLRRRGRGTGSRLYHDAAGARDRRRRRHRLHPIAKQQGVSTITARLKLNYDANKALSDISSKVDAIRRDLPPESRDSGHQRFKPADSQFASGLFEFYFQYPSA